MEERKREEWELETNPEGQLYFDFSGTHTYTIRLCWQFLCCNYLGEREEMVELYVHKGIALRDAEAMMDVLMRVCIVVDTRRHHNSLHPNVCHLTYQFCYL